MVTDSFEDLQLAVAWRVCWCFHFQQEGCQTACEFRTSNHRGKPQSGDELGFSVFCSSFPISIGCWTQVSILEDFVSSAAQHFSQLLATLTAYRAFLSLLVLSPRHCPSFLFEKFASVVFGFVNRPASWKQQWMGEQEFTHLVISLFLAVWILKTLSLSFLAPPPHTHTS